MLEPHPMPPVGPPPPHASPPPPHEHGRGVLPSPPSGLTASETHGTGYEIKTSSRHHAPVYRVGSSRPGAAPTTTGSDAQVLAEVQAFLEAHKQAAQAATISPPTPSTMSITATTEPTGATAGLAESPSASVMDRYPGLGGAHHGPPFPPYKGAHGAE